MSFNGYDLHNHRGLELSDYSQGVNHARYFYDPEGMKRDVQKEEQRRPSQPPFPWRRFFARSIDMSIYGMAFDAIAAIVFKINISDLSFPFSIVSVVVSIIVMLLLEPFFLSRWGTTPGKWIWGIKVTDKWGRNLEYKDARTRTWEVLCYGYGFHIPIYSIYRMWKCYKACKNSELIVWEQDTYIELKDKDGWRIGAYIGAEIAAMAVTFLLFMISMLPVHQGNISVKEFSENFNHYASFYGIESEDRYLDENGKWITKDEPYFFDIYLEDEWPEFQYVEENGILKEVAFEMHSTDGETYMLPSEAVYLASISFMRAQSGYIPVFEKTKGLFTMLEAKQEGNTSFSAYGVRMDYSIQADGYLIEEGFCWPEEDGNKTLDIIFRLVKE